MRLCLLACLVVTAPAMVGCAAESIEPELETAEADEPVLMLVTVRAGVNFTACVAAADSFEGIDLLLELPRLRKFVATSSIAAPDAANALLAFPCVEAAEFDLVGEEAFCADFSAGYCAKAFECMTPEELGQFGWFDVGDCVTTVQPLACGMVDQCTAFDAEAGATCNTEVETGTCEQFRESFPGSQQTTYPACGQICAEGFSLPGL